MGQRYYTTNDYTKYPNGSRCYRSPMPFASVAKVENCPCEDGKRRNVFVQGEPDTFFSLPAVVSVKGKYVSGFLTTADDGWKFIAYSYGKHAALLKPKV